MGGPVGSGVCPYCQTPIKAGAAAAVCPDCRATHHAECWRENGRCTTFGCMGTPPMSAGEPRESSPRVRGMAEERGSLDWQGKVWVGLTVVSAIGLWASAGTVPGRELSSVGQSLALCGVALAVARLSRAGYYLAQTVCVLQVLVGLVSVHALGWWAGAVALYGGFWFCYFRSRRELFGVGIQASAPRPDSQSVAETRGHPPRRRTF